MNLPALRHMSTWPRSTGYIIVFTGIKTYVYVAILMDLYIKVHGHTRLVSRFGLAVRR